MNESLEGITSTSQWLLASPFLLMGLICVPLLLLMWIWKVYPRLPLVIATGLPCLAALPLAFGGEDLWAGVTQKTALWVLVIDCLIAAVAFLDLATLPWGKVFTADRVTGKTASLQKLHHVTLTLTNHSRRDRLIDIRDDVPEGFFAEPEQFSLLLRARSRATVNYEMRAHRRGAFQMDHVYTRTQSRCRLWWRNVTCDAESSLNVYPDMKQLSQYAVLARTNRLSLVGVRRTRRVGQDNEFERLRDYTLDDHFRHIDWRSTARRSKLTVKDFQVNQSQRLIFLVDTGRMMTNLSSGVSLLDHSLNAMLMLSYVALSQGDSVGMMCFSDKVQSYVPPRGSMSQMNRLLHASYDQFPHLNESRYDEAFFHLSRHCRKRALVILITNVIDEVNANQVQNHLSTLVGRHLPLGVLLRDHALFDAAEQEPHTSNDWYRAGAAAEILNWRHQVLRDLEQRGAMSLDVYPEDMTAPLVNSYLNIKARHLL